MRRRYPLEQRSLIRIFIGIMPVICSQVCILPLANRCMTNKDTMAFAF